MSLVEFKSGDILAEDVDALVNSVNCVGVMGRGIALQFKRAFPGNFEAYRLACKRGEVTPGEMFVFETGLLDGPRFIINFPTKRHWRGKSRMEDVEAGLSALVREVNQRNISSIAIPPLATGLGGLDWAVVRARMLSAFSKLDKATVAIFNPRLAPGTGRGFRSSDTPTMTPGRAALVALVNRYLAGLLDPYVTLLEIHKLLYFVQHAGEPLRLRFTADRYGPYSAQLRHILNALEGHYTEGYGDGGDSPFKRIGLVDGAVEKANAFLNESLETKKRIDRVAVLVDGYESPLGLELLATVHWIASQNPSILLDRLVELAYQWGNRKKQFSPRQLEIALQTLRELRWLS